MADLGGEWDKKATRMNLTIFGISEPYRIFRDVTDA